MAFTKREKIIFIAIGLIIFTFAFLLQFTAFEATKGWEVLFLIFIVFPIGLLIATDPERIKKDK